MPAQMPLAELAAGFRRIADEADTLMARYPDAVAVRNQVGNLNLLDSRVDGQWFAIVHVLLEPRIELLDQEEAADAQQR